LASNKIFEKAILTVCLFCFLSISGNAQCIPNETYLRDYNKIINLQGYDKVASDPVSVYLKHLQYTINYLITEDENILDSLESSEDGFITTISENCKDPYKTFYLAEIRLRNAFISAKTGSELTASWQLRQAFKMLDENISEYPTFTSQYKTMGLLHILLGSVPEKHQWVIELLGMQGNIKGGLDELKMVSEKDDFFRLEAKIYSLIIDAFLLNKADNASKEILNLLNDYPQNELITYLAISVLLKNNDAKSALNVLEEIKIDKNPLLYYQAGEIYLQSGDYNRAESYYRKFLNEFKGQNFLKDTYYKLFLTQWLANNESSALNYYTLAQNTGQKLIEADKHANSVLRSDEFPNPSLMKVRLFTDGGYILKADSMLNYLSMKSFTSYKDKTEFLYRQARLKHKQNHIEKARLNYLKVLSRQFNGEYFIPNSSLQLGYIMQEQGKTEVSKKYFEKTLTYKGYQYESSIKNKAKSALKLID